MAVKKIYIYIGVLIIAILIILTIFTFVSKKSNLQCAKTKEYFSEKRCGYINITQSDERHRISGKIIKKYRVKQDNFIQFKTLNSKGEEIIYPVTFPSNRPTYLENLTPKNQLRAGAQINPSKQLTSDELFSQIKVNDEVLLQISTPKEEKIQLATKKYGEIKMFQCYEYNKDFISYIKDSNIKNHLNLIVSKFSTNCDLYSIQVTTLP